MEEEQGAFRPERQTQDHIYTLRAIMEKNIASKKPRYIRGFPGPKGCI